MLFRSCPRVVSLSSTLDPPYEQGLVVVVAGLPCPCCGPGRGRGHHPSSSRWSTHNPHTSRCSLWRGGCWVSAVVPSSGVVAPILVVVVPSSFSPSSPHRCHPFFLIVVPVFSSSPCRRRPCPWSSLSCRCRQQVYLVPKNLLVIN